MNRAKALLQLVWDRMHEQEVAGHFPHALLVLIEDEIDKEDEHAQAKDESGGAGTLP